MRRVRLLGLFNAVELDEQLPDPDQLPLELGPRLDYGAAATYDPLSDPLNDPLEDERA